MQYPSQEDIDRLLASLPQWSPRPGLADRVMAQVRLADPFYLHALARLRRHIVSSRRAFAAAASVLVFLAGSMSASIVWTMSHRAVLESAARWVRVEVTHGLWLAGRGALTAFLEQPWAASITNWFGSGGHLAFAAGGAVVAYVAGLWAMRRLLTAPVPHSAHGQA